MVNTDGLAREYRRLRAEAGVALVAECDPYDQSRATLTPEAARLSIQALDAQNDARRIAEEFHVVEVARRLPAFASVKRVAWNHAQTAGYSTPDACRPAAQGYEP